MIIGMIRYAIPNVFIDRNNSRNLIQLYEEPYFSDRFNIFKNITLESFKQQTNKDFILLVYHTNLIPIDKKKLFDEIEEIYPFVRNIYIPDTNMYIPEDLRENKIFTFRIDNDDGVAIDFIERLYNESINNNIINYVITIPYIRKLMRISDNLFLTIGFNYPLKTHSIGLAYFSDNNKTIFDLGNHLKMSERFLIKELKGYGGLQIINGYNVANNINSINKKYTSEEIYNILKNEKYPNINLFSLPICNINRKV